MHYLIIVVCDKLMKKANVSHMVSTFEYLMSVLRLASDE